MEELQYSCQLFPSAYALNFHGKKITYQKLWEMIEKFAASLVRMKITHVRDRVAILLPNCPQAVISYFGILKAGAIVVPCNPLYTEKELAYQINDADVSTIVALDLFYPKVKKVKRIIDKNHILKNIIVTSIADFLPFPLSKLFPLGYPLKIKSAIKKCESPKEIELLKEDLARFYEAKMQIKQDQREIFSFKNLINAKITTNEKFILETFRNPSVNDIAVLQYTGGTTGVSKGAMLTHKNLSANVEQVMRWFYEARPGKEKFLAALPLFHIFGMTITQNLCLRLGGEMILVPNAKDLPEVIKTIVTQKPTIVPGVPRLFNALVGKYKGQDFSSIKYCISGGAKLPLSVIKNFEKITGGKLVEGYGLTEASPVTHCNPLGGLTKDESIGVPLPQTEAKVMVEVKETEEKYKEASWGEVGELWVRGPQVMQGYLNRPEETVRVILENNWLKTGDLAIMDQDGYFSIVDRQKNMILSDSGFNVYPNEIEEALRLHHCVADAAAIGIPTEDGKENIKVFVVLKENCTVSAEELIKHCKESLTYYKIPKFVEFRSELPLTMIGKTNHRALREEEMSKVKK